jgi:hypothetical protein
MLAGPMIAAAAAPVVPAAGVPAPTAVLATATVVAAATRPTPAVLTTTPAVLTTTPAVLAPTGVATAVPRLPSPPAPASTASSSTPVGAATPAAVTHGLTLRGAQLTYALLCGAKRVENRHFRMQPGWYALHTGNKTSAHESQHALIAAVPGMPTEADLPHGAIVGAIRVSHALALEQCAGDPWAFGPVCNVVDAVARLERPVSHKGALSVWRLGAETLADVQAQLERAAIVENDVSHLPGKEAAPKTINVRKAGGGKGSGKDTPTSEGAHEDAHDDAHDDAHEEDEGMEAALDEAGEDEAAGEAGEAGEAVEASLSEAAPPQDGDSSGVPDEPPGVPIEVADMAA